MDLKLPEVNIDRKDLLMAVLAVAAVVLIAFCGWTLYADHTEADRITEFSLHVLDSEADLFLLSCEITSHMESRRDYPLIAEYDAWMQKLGALADYGRDLTHYHRYVIAADGVPEPYAGAQDAYVRALDNLNRAFRSGPRAQAPMMRRHTRRQTPVLPGLIRHGRSISPRSVTTTRSS